MVLFPRTCAFPRLPVLPTARHYAPRANAATPPPLHEHPVAGLPRRWVVFSDLHVRQDTLPVCLQLLRTVADEARARAAGVICLGDFWHASGVLSTRQLTAVLSELHGLTTRLSSLLYVARESELVLDMTIIRSVWDALASYKGLLWLWQ